MTDLGSTAHATRTFWATSALVVLVTGLAVLAASILHRYVGLAELRSHAGLLIAVGAGGFLVAASLRYAAFLVTGLGDLRSRAVACLVAATVLMPLHLWTHGLAVEATTAEELAVLGTGRVLGAVLVVTTLVLAMARPRWPDRLCIVAVAAWTLALAFLALGTTVARAPEAMPMVLSAMAFLSAALWGATAGYAAHRTDTRPWASSMAPFLMLMGMTEVLVALDPRASGTGATAAVLLVALLSVAAVVRALHDLRNSVREEHQRAADLERDLLSTRDDLVALQQQERRIAHDARGTLAGVRAAMHVWAFGSGGAGNGTEDLRRAALVEVARLEDTLREHRVRLGCGPVALDLVVDRAARVALARGAEIKVDVPRLVVLGHATDLELALREVIDRCLLADPEVRLELDARPEDGNAVLLVRRATHEPLALMDPSEVMATDDLTHASRLLGRTGAELHHDVQDGALRVVVPLCPAPAGVPRQRTAGDTPARRKVPA